MAYVTLSCGKKLRRTGTSWAVQGYALGYRQHNKHSIQNPWGVAMKEEWEAIPPPKPTLVDFMNSRLHMDHYTDVQAESHKSSVIVGDKIHEFHEDGRTDPIRWLLWHPESRTFEKLEEADGPSPTQALRMREFSPLANPSSTCTCDDGVCRVEQHFAARDQPFQSGQTNVLYAVCQGMKSRQAVAMMVITWIENGYLPVLMTRNIGADIGQWQDTVDSYNQFAGDEMLKAVVYRREMDVQRHINEGRTGTPILIIMYNGANLKNITNLWSYGFVAQEGRFRKIHLVIDEADIIAISQNATSATEKRMWGQHEDTIFHDDAALITWVTATPLALFINRAHLGTRAQDLVKVFRIDPVSQYYAYEDQGLDQGPLRTIRFGDAGEVDDVIVDAIINSPRARRCLFVSPKLKTLVAQRSYAMHYSNVYNNDLVNTVQKTVVCIAWCASKTSVYVGGDSKFAYLDKMGRTSGFTGQADGSFFFDGRLPELYDAIMHICSTVICKRPSEDDGPDILVFAGALADRGARLESSSHQWILTDMQMIGIDKWTLESIVQVAGRLNASSPIDIQKTLWASRKDMDRVRGAMRRNAELVNILIANGYTNMIEHLQSLFDKIGGDYEKLQDHLTDLKPIQDRVPMSRAGVAKAHKRKEMEFREEVLEPARKKKSIVLEYEPPGHDVEVARSSISTGLAANSGARGRAEPDYAGVWSNPDTEAIFRDILDDEERMSGEALAKELVEKKAMKNVAQAKKLLKYGRDNPGVAPWMCDSKNPRPGAWLTFGPRGWTTARDEVQNVADGERGQAGIVHAELCRMFDIGQSFTLDNLKELEIWRDIERGHQRVIYMLTKSGYLKNLGRATYCRMK